MASYLATFIAAVLLAMVFTHRVRGLARQYGWLDVPDKERREHELAVPRLGGVAIYATLLAVLGAAILFRPAGIPEFAISPQLYAIMAGATAIFALGLWDDLKGVAAGVKFFLEVAIALSLWLAGIRIDDIGLPGGVFVFPEWLSAVITVFWIVGITNAFNLIDGSDGVAAGAAVFAAGSIAAVSLMAGHDVGAVAALAIAGAALGFVTFNFPPASIFLGDCGALLLGFLLATLGMLSAQTAPTVLAVAIPVVSFGLPILDTLLAMFRRFLRGERIFNADRGHIHHRLKDLGHSPRKVALLLYGACAIFALLSLLLVHPAGAATATLFVVAGAVIWLAVQRLHIPELLEVNRIFDRGMRQRAVIANNVRVREAIVRLSRAEDPHAVIDALVHALNTGDFARAEMWVEERLGGYLATAGLAEREGAGVFWDWTRDDSDNGNGWEFRVRFRDSTDRVIGRLSLWGASEIPAVLTDLRLVAAELQPALQLALVRAQRWAPPVGLIASTAAQAEAPRTLPAHKPQDVLAIRTG